MKKKIIILLLFLIPLKSNSFVQPWTWAYCKIFTHNEIEEHKKQQQLVWEINITFNFNQLVLSWNAERPKKGYFLFKTLVRDAITGNWHCWPASHIWGNDKQKSLGCKKGINSIDYFQARLEERVNHNENGLKIIVEAHEGADFSVLKALYVSIANFDLFEHEHLCDEEIAKMPSMKIHGVPKISQLSLHHPRRKVICSPVAATMVTSYLTHQKIDPLLFASKVYDSGLDAFGSWPYNTAHMFEYLQDNFYVRTQRCHSFATLHDRLRKGIPTVVSIRGHLDGAPKDYNNGHLLVVVGWQQENKKVICHDPAIFGHNNVERAYNLDSFLIAWERSKRLTYYVIGKDEFNLEH